LLLFDTTNIESFEHVADWLQEARKQIEPNDAVFILVGTKKDKEHSREVPIEQAQQFADYHNLLYIETSSKTGQNVENAFIELSSKIYEQLEKGKFRIQEGWDGIKSGYMKAVVTNPNSNTNTRPAISLVDANSIENHKSSKKSCC
jgi:Ras-related protein Rab-39B